MGISSPWDPWDWYICTYLYTCTIEINHSCIGKCIGSMDPTGSWKPTIEARGPGSSMRRVQQLSHATCLRNLLLILRKMIFWSKNPWPHLSQKLFDLFVKGPFFVVPQLWIKFVTKRVTLQSSMMVCGLYCPSPALLCFAYTNTTYYLCKFVYYISLLPPYKGKLDKIPNLNEDLFWDDSPEGTSFGINRRPIEERVHKELWSLSNVWSVCIW